MGTASPILPSICAKLPLWLVPSRCIQAPLALEKVITGRFRHCASTPRLEDFIRVACALVLDGSAGAFGVWDHESATGYTGRIVPRDCPTSFGARVSGA